MHGTNAEFNSSKQHFVNTLDKQKLTQISDARIEKTKRCLV